MEFGLSCDKRFSRFSRPGHATNLTEIQVWVGLSRLGTSFNKVSLLLSFCIGHGKGGKAPNIVPKLITETQKAETRLKPVHDVLRVGANSDSFSCYPFESGKLGKAHLSQTDSPSCFNAE